MSFSFSQRSLDNMEGVNPKLIEIAHRAIRISPIDFGIPGDGGLRTEEQQLALHAAGKSQLDGVVRKSYHQTGNALDVFAFKDGRGSWDREHLAIVAAAMLQSAGQLGYKLEWGGLWTRFIDFPHFQLSKEQ